MRKITMSGWYPNAQVGFYDGGVSFKVAVDKDHVDELPADLKKVIEAHYAAEEKRKTFSKWDPRSWKNETQAGACMIGVFIFAIALVLIGEVILH